MTIRAVIIDFDNTIVSVDLSDVLCAMAGKEKESEQLKNDFFEGRSKGLEGLIQRVNFLEGLSMHDIQRDLAGGKYLRPGARELFNYFRTQNIISIISSGSIEPVLALYQNELGADYIVGSRPHMEGEYIGKISLADYSSEQFKIDEPRSILEKLDIPASATIGIGDSPADKGIFDYCAYTIGVNPHPTVADIPDVIVEDDLSLIIPLLEGIKA